ncbi:FAD-dependent monooxygenase [Streptomyces sp. NPDC054933]
MAELNGPVLVAGAGIGGLAVARALRLRGYQVIVIERADETRGLAGSGLTIWTNALTALDRIGLADEAVRRGMRLDWQRLHSAAGETIHQVPVGRIGAAIGRQGVGIRRQALLGLLLEGCADVEVRYRARLVDLDQNGDGVRVRLENGEEITAALLVGADGLRSRTRALLGDDAPPEPEGHMIWRGISDSHAGFPEHTSYMVYGKDGARSVAWPVGPDAVCWSVSRNGPPRHGESADPQELKRALLAMTAGFPEPVTAVIGATPASRILRTDLFGRPEVVWGDGRVALVGDASHAMPTVYGQGACQAIEDAVVFADALSAAETPEQGIRDYARRRDGRVGWIRQRTFQLSRYQGWELPLLIALRDATMRALPAEATERTWQTLLTFDDGSPENRDAA